MQPHRSHNYSCFPYLPKVVAFNIALTKFSENFGLVAMGACLSSHILSCASLVASIYPLDAAAYKGSFAVENKAYRQPVHGTEGHSKDSTKHGS
eukprot:1158309-Pelagomonas_calceolata.AAC.3